MGSSRREEGSWAPVGERKGHGGRAMWSSRERKGHGPCAPVRRGRAKGSSGAKGIT